MALHRWRPRNTVDSPFKVDEDSKEGKGNFVSCAKKTDPLVSLEAATKEIHKKPPL